MKRNLFLFTLLFTLNIFSSCKKDDNMVSGQITYYNSDSEKVPVLLGTKVYLFYVNEYLSREVATTTTDSEGKYAFYPVEDDDNYYVYAEMEYNDLYHYKGISEEFSVKRKDELIIDLELVKYEITN